MSESLLPIDGPSFTESTESTESTQSTGQKVKKRQLKVLRTIERAHTYFCTQENHAHALVWPMRLLCGEEEGRVALSTVQAAHVLHLPVSNPTHNKTQSVSRVCVFFRVGVGVFVCVCVFMPPHKTHNASHTRKLSVAHAPTGNTSATNAEL